MNKFELVSALATKTGTTKTEASKFLNAFIESITTSLSKKEAVILVGFGKFYTTYRNACKGTNPRTREAIDISACTSPKFKPGKKLKSKLN